MCGACSVARDHYFFNFRSDATAPPATILNPVASSTWKTSTYPLSGHANERGGDQGSFVRVYRNGALVDSVSSVGATSSSTFPFCPDATI